MNKPYSERLELLMTAKLKSLTMSKIAKESGLNCSVSWISQYFSNKCQMPLHSEQKLEKFINDYQK